MNDRKNDRAAAVALVTGIFVAFANVAPVTSNSR